MIKVWRTALGECLLRSQKTQASPKLHCHRLKSISMPGMSGRSRSSTVPQSHCVQPGAGTAFFSCTSRSVPQANENHPAKASFLRPGGWSSVHSTIEFASFRTNGIHRGSANRAIQTRCLFQTAPNATQHDARSEDSEHAMKKSQPQSPTCKPHPPVRIRGALLALASPQLKDQAPYRSWTEANGVKKLSQLFGGALRASHKTIITRGAHVQHKEPRGCAQRYISGFRMRLGFRMGGVRSRSNRRLPQSSQ